MAFHIPLIVAKKIKLLLHEYNGASVNGRKKSFSHCFTGNDRKRNSAVLGKTVDFFF